MEIKTTKEEIENLLDNLHSECTEAARKAGEIQISEDESRCDLQPLWNLLRESNGVGEFLLYNVMKDNHILLRAMYGGDKRLKALLLYLMSAGIKIGYQIKEREIVDMMKEAQA